MKLGKSQISRWVRCRTNAKAKRHGQEGPSAYGNLNQFGWPEGMKMGQMGRHGVIEKITEGETDRKYVVRAHNAAGEPMSLLVEIEATKLDTIS